MTAQRIKEFIVDFENALSRLQEAINSDVQEDILIDAVIQRFEFTFELSWKLMRVYLNYQGITCNSPRQAIKEAYKEEIIENGDGWIDMLIDRNRTSHIYDETVAFDIFTKIKSVYIDLFLNLSEHFKKLPDLDS